MEFPHIVLLIHAAIGLGSKLTFPSTGLQVKSSESVFQYLLHFKQGTNFFNSRDKGYFSLQAVNDGRTIGHPLMMDRHSPDKRRKIKGVPVTI